MDFSLGTVPALLEDESACSEKQLLMEWCSSQGVAAALPEFLLPHISVVAMGRPFHDSNRGITTKSNIDCDSHHLRRLRAKPAHVGN